MSAARSMHLLPDNKRARQQMFRATGQERKGPITRAKEQPCCFCGEKVISNSEDVACGDCIKAWDDDRYFVPYQTHKSVGLRIEVCTRTLEQADPLSRRWAGMKEVH